MDNVPMQHSVAEAPAPSSLTGTHPGGCSFTFQTQAPAAPRPDERGLANYCQVVKDQ